MAKITEPGRGEYILEERDLIALKALQVGYQWLRAEHGLRLLFLGLAETIYHPTLFNEARLGGSRTRVGLGYQLTDAGRKVLSDDARADNDE